MVDAFFFQQKEFTETVINAIFVHDFAAHQVHRALHHNRLFGLSGLRFVPTDAENSSELNFYTFLFLFRSLISCFQRKPYCFNISCRPAWTSRGSPWCCTPIRSSAKWSLSLSSLTNVVKPPFKWASWSCFTLKWPMTSLRRKA